MANEIQIYQQKEILGKEFNIYGTWEEPLILAKDVADWIEYSLNSKGKRDVSTMLKNIDEDEKLVRTIFVPGQDGRGQNREVWFLTEDGVYEVLMQSRKPRAKEFKKQVKKILKEIRTMGYYLSSEFLNSPQCTMQLAQGYIQVTHENEELKDYIEEIQPKVEAYDELLECSTALSFGDTAKLLGVKGMGRNNMIAYLRDNHVLMNDNIPYQKYVNEGKFDLKQTKVSKPNGTTITKTQTRVTQKGIDHILRMYRKDGYTIPRKQFSITNLLSQ